MMKPLLLCVFWVLSVGWVEANERARALIAKSENHVRGKTFQGDLSMVVTHGTSNRTLEMKIWSQGREKALIKIIQPIKDKNSGNLRLGLELWQFLPNIDRIVKIPPSMMLQSWMGSDFTNDDLVKSSSLERDYTHSILGNETWNGEKATKILCIPKPDAPIVWGKIIAWVRDPDGVPLKQEFYSEDGELLKILEGSEIKTFGTHILPTVLKMKTIQRPDSQTVIQYHRIQFDEPISASHFTQEMLRKPVR